MNQNDLIAEILAHNPNMVICGKSPQLWHNMQVQYRNGKLSDKKQREMLTAMGYVIVEDRKWGKIVAS